VWDNHFFDKNQYSSSFISSNVLVEEGIVGSHSLVACFSLQIHAGQVKHSLPFDAIAGGEQRELHVYSIRRALLLAVRTLLFARTTSIHLHSSEFRAFAP
jgi:hypothetical protein